MLRGEAPCHKVYEDDRVLAFMDLMPQAEGHTLVIPKEAAATLFDLSPQAAAACIEVVRRLAHAVTAAVGAEGLMVMQMNGSAAGQTVPHAHFHLIPRWSGRALKGHAAERANAGQLAAIAARIVACLGGP